MKRVIYLLCITLATINCLTGCKKFLDTKPTDTLSPEDYYSTESNLVQALAGVYDRLGSESIYANMAWSSIDGTTDDSYNMFSSTVQGIPVYAFDYTDATLSNLWNECYKGILRANILIANINLPKMDETKRAIILAEAKFLRGFYYFKLVQMFGDVPLRLDPVTSPVGTDIARTSAKDVYAQILKDMTEAEEKLPNSSQIVYSSRVSKTVADGMLARVCLHMAGQPLNDQSKYAEALAWAKKVQTSGEHELRTTFNSVFNNSNFTHSAFSQIFIDQCQDKYDVKESMWEVDFKGNRTDGYVETFFGANMGIAMTNVAFQNDTGYCYGGIKATGRLYKLYGNGDLRRDWTIANYTYNGSTCARVPTPNNPNNYNTRFPGKWRRSYELAVPKNKNYCGTNYPILRYADVLLMLAEAENQVNGPTATAYEALNMVRRRGYGLPIGVPSATADAPAGMSKVAFQLYIEDERSRELAFESLRRQDLIRWGKFITNMKTVADDIALSGNGNSYAQLPGRNVSERHLLFPIPASEMSVNKKMVQNPGW